LKNEFEKNFFKKKALSPSPLFFLPSRPNLSLFLFLLAREGFQANGLFPARASGLHRPSLLPAGPARAVSLFLLNTRG
jgi:hypothetical protein